MLPEPTTRRRMNAVMWFLNFNKKLAVFKILELQRNLGKQNWSNRIIQWNKISKQICLFGLLIYFGIHVSLFSLRKLEINFYSLSPSDLPSCIIRKLSACTRMPSRHPKPTRLSRTTKFLPELGIEPETPGPKPSTLSTRLSLQRLHIAVFHEC